MKGLTDDKRMKILLVAFSFVVPFIVMLLAFAVEGLAPFGSRTICAMDGFSQYYPMLENMKQAIRDKEIFYSFSGALGFNLFAQSAYYTNSPLWLIYYILPEGIKFAGLHFIVLFKIGLAGLFFALWFLYKRKKPLDNKGFLWGVALSCAWALSGYMIAFINQLMWQDIIVLLPLTVTGLEILYEKGRPTLYITSLAVSIFSCFYISYMVCIFMVLYFLFMLFREKRESLLRFKRCVLFAFSSLIAGAVCAVVLLPTVKALSLTLAGEGSAIEGIEIKYTLWEFLRSLLPFGEISLEYGAPNLYCGVISVILAVLFFINKETEKREKIVAFVLLSFMNLSMSINVGEYVWHGFHFPNQLPARQSFLVIFLILSLAALACERLSFSSGVNMLLGCVLIFGIVCSSTMAFMSQVWTANIFSLTRYDKTMEGFKSLTDDELFVRREWSGEKKNNSPQQYSYNGVIYYSSTMSGAAYEFFQALGIERYAKNVSTYYDGSDILNTLFGIRYILKDKGLTVEENPLALPLCYLASPEVRDIDPGAFGDGEKAQQALWESIILNKNEDFNAAAKELKKNGISLEEFDTDYIRGKITCEKDGVLLTTLPYDGGWEIIIDGEKAETFSSAGYLTSAEIRKGSHEIEMIYTVPGIKAGAVISGLALAAFFGLMIVVRKRKDI